MRRLLFVAVLATLALPVAAQDKPLPEGCGREPYKLRDGTLMCEVYLSGGYRDERVVDPVGWRVAPDERRWKLSVGFAGSDRIRANTPTAGMNENFGEGSFVQMLGTAIGSWLAEKDGSHRAQLTLNNGTNASLTVLTDNP